VPRFWQQALLRVALLAAAGGAIGGLYGEVWLGLFAAMLVGLVYQLVWLARLDSWLNGEDLAFLPEGEGVWARVFSRIDYLRQRARRRGKRFKALVKQLRQATRSFPDGVVILNDSREIVVFNQAAGAMLGFKNQDRGLRIENLVRNPDFVKYLRAKEQSQAVEIQSPLQPDAWLLCHIVPYGLSQKMLLVRDVTQQHKIEHMRRDFVANASHELRTPLTVITGYLEAIADDPQLSAELRAPVDEMQKQSQRMRQLVDELLRLSELEAEPGAVGGTRVDMRAVIETARQEARALPDCPATVESVYDSEQGLRGVRKDIQSIVSNLVSNAARYTPPTGKIVIRWWTTEAGAFLSVRDTGRGIASEHIPRLCERFYRVENGRERIGGEGGTGLGLAIVRHALLRHGGSLNIESTLGVGSTFTCQFPASRIVAVD
jgi:two-component system phosphate regulon sensor histidine kinase PhoR